MINRNIYYLLLVGHCLAIQPLEAQTHRPNIVFIMADDLGAHDLGSFGSDFYETPHIDQLATQGVRFTQAYAAGANSAPSRACFMTGMYSPRHGVYTVSPSERGDVRKRRLIPVANTEDVAASFVTLGEALHQAGYQCAHIGKWHMGDDKEGTGPLSQGFDLNIGGDRRGSPYSYYYPYCNKTHTQCHGALEGGKEGEYLTDRLTTEAERFIQQRDPSRPFFLYLSHYAVHTPLTAPQDLVDKYRRKSPGKRQSNPIYAAMVEKMDHSVGRIMTLLDSLKLSDNTLFVFCSDNGGTFQATDNYPLRGEKGTPYEGGIRVPLIMRYPAKLKAGTTCHVPVINIDFFPTLVDEAKGVCPTGLDGQNLFKLMEAQCTVSRELYWHFPAYLESYRDGGFRATPYSIVRSGVWKLIYSYETATSRLFNLQTDEAEQTDLSVTEPEQRRRLEALLFRWLRATDAPIPNKLNPKYQAH